MLVQLRSATAGDVTGGQPIEKATANDLVFLVPTQSASLTNNARGVVHTRYCLDTSSSPNAMLWMQTAPYDTASNSTSPSTTACPSTAWPTQQHVASYLVNQLQSPAVSLFTTNTDSAGNVTDITVRALVDVNTSTDPRATDLQSRVTLRNLNRQPTADVTCQAESSGHAICDASGSVDPDGENLTYSWTMDGSPLSATGYRLDQYPLVSQSTHSFTVTITDPGGLTSSATRSITMP
jgi:hypothetical protein